MTSDISRRSLAKGAAWAAPAVLATAAVPAYAASCGQVAIRYGGGIGYSFGTIGSTSTNQQLSLGGNVWVDNLPTGVTVTSMTYTFWIQNRDGQDSPGSGAFYVKNRTSDRASQNISAMPWTPTAGSGFSNSAYSTVNLATHTFSNGATAQAWDLNLTWNASRDSNISSRYTTTANGCRTFDSGASGRFRVNYTGVHGPTSLGNTNEYVRGETRITITLSDGRVLNYVSQTTDIVPR